MVAVFTGNGLGLFNTSLTQLGGALGGSGGLGQDRSRQLVNLATGNVLVQGQDEYLSFRGLGLGFERTYNSQGQASEVGADGWLTGFERRVVLQSGTFNTAGSMMRRYTGDGAYQDFTYVSANTYLSTGGDGAHDTLNWTAGSSTWTYVEGSSRREELYADHANATLLGRLTRIRDLKSDGTTPVTWDVLYDASNRISEIRANDGASTGEALVFGYDGSGRLSSVSTRENGIVRSQVSYGYDGQGRLLNVTTDLTPDNAGDNAWDGATLSNNNGKLYRTEYTYEGATLRLASLKQSDGTLVSYTYHADGRVKTVTQGDSNIDDTDGLGETTSYAYGTGSTTVTDSLGRAWVYAYDANGQLSSVTGPAIAGQSDITTYQYDAAGNLTQAQTVRGGITLSLLDYQYDANGNLVWQWDAQGNAISRTYNANNQLLTETRYTGVDADRNGGVSAPTGGLTTQYVYDAQNRVRFVVNALGEVTEFTYATSGNGIGQRNAVRQYLGGVDTGASWTESVLVAWATGVEKANSTLVEFVYDLAGRLSQRNDYAGVDGNGAGVVDAATAITRYIYSAQDLLLQQITLHGAGRTPTGAAQSGSEVMDYAYDGMGRLLSVLSRDSGLTNNDANTVQTTYAYIDSAYQIAVTNDLGAVRTETRNRAGRVVSVTEADKAVAPTITRTTTHTYDGAGQLRISQDAGGGLSYFFYDGKGRLEATVDATGAGVRNTYDGLDRVVGTRAYAGRVTTTGWTTLATLPTGWAGTGLVDNDALDRVSATTYDTAGRIATVTDGLASSTQRSITTYTYDAAGRLLQTRQTDSVATAATARVVRYFYDNAGRQIGQLDAEGYLTESAYDRAGRLVSQVRYATVSPSAQWASGTLAQLRPPLNANNDQTTHYYYNGRGQLVGTLDAQGYLSELIVDEAGNTRAERRYATAVTWAGTDTLSTLRSRAGIHRESRLAYNGLGQLLARTNAEGTVTRYTYDEAGRLVKTESAQGTSEIRENNRRYNVFGELIGELGGEGSVQLLAGMSEAQLDAVYAQYGVRHSYDALGRRIESIDAGGNKSWYFYDSVGRLTFTVKGVADSGNVLNALGEVSELRYTAFGEVSESLVYTGRIAIPVAGDRNSVSGAIGTLSYAAATDTRRQFAYTTRGQLASTTDAENTLTQYNYDAFGQLSRQVSAVGTAAVSTTDFLYDRRGLSTRRTDGVGAAVERFGTQSYDAFGRVIGAVDGRGSTTSFTYDRLGRQLTTSQVVSGRTETVTVSYNAYERVSVTDAKGQTTSYSYSPTARTLAVATLEGITVTTAYNRHGQVLTVSDVWGQATSYTYNRDGQLTGTTDPLYQTATQEYDVRGLLVATVDASGRRVELRYDAVGRVLQRIVDPGAGKLNLTTSYAYDGQGRQLTVADPSGRVSGYSYDREGRLTQVTQDPAGLNLRSTYSYDAQGRQVTVTQGAATASAQVTQYAFDALGRRTSETLNPGGLNLTTQYAYDKNDNVVRRTDANGAITRYYYDEADRLIFTVDPLGGLTRNWYDLNGSLAAVRSFSQKLTPAQLTGLSDASTIAQLDALAVWNANDLSQYQIYDHDGRLRFQIDVSGRVRETLYDPLGRVVGTRSYAASFALGVLNLSSQLHAGTATLADITVAKNDALDQLNWQVLDEAGRVRYTVDGLGNVQELYYDAADRHVGTRSMATAIALNAGLRSRLETGTVLLTDLASVIYSDAKDLRSYQVLDAVGRLRYTVDAFGSVQEYSLDAAGRTVGTRRYGQAIVVDATLLEKLKAGTATVADLAAKVTANDALDQRGYQVFDEAGRLRLSIDAQGNAQELRYDATGRVIQQLTYGTAIAAATLSANLAALKAGTVSVATAVGWVSSQEATARMTTSIWDAGGRLRYTLARTGSTYMVSELRYDAVGRVVAQVAYATTIPTATAGTVAAIAAAVTTAGGDAAANQRMTRMVYDADGQVRYTVDDLGGVTERRYNGLGQLVEARQYALAIPTSTAATEAAVATAVAGQTGANVRITTTTYDGAGRVSTVTDAAGKSEFYGYDALGNRTSYTNKLGNVWTYGYDAAGRRISETSPAIKVAVADAAGVVSLVTRTVVTQIAYDALGNVTQRTEDATGAKPRITQYQYDNRGHQIKTIFPDAGAIDPATGAINATGTTPTIEVTYNALGQAVVQKDVRGNYSYKTYDSLGQLAYEVDQEGYVTGYTYNAFGEQATLRRYASRLGAIGGWSAGTAISLPQLTASVVIPSATLDRTLTTSYDSLGRQTQVQQSAVTYVKADGTMATGTPTTQFTYNSYGEVVKTAVLLDAANNVWTNTYQYYDELGHNTVTVDAEGYVSTTVYNAMGEVTQSTEHARALSSVAMAALTTATAPAAPSTGDALTGYDRVMRWEYDAMGRKLSEIVVRRYQNADGSAGVRDVKTDYTYDNAGRATMVTSDAGTAHAAVTTTEYDALDRVVSVKEPVRATLVGNSESLLLGNTAVGLGSAALYAQVSPYTTMAYDGFGNLVAVRRYANGWAAGAPAPGATDDARDQVQVTRYDWQGRAVWEKDGEGNLTTRTYDAADHLLSTRYTLTAGTMASSVVVATAVYDKAGRQTSNQLTRGGVTDSSESVSYNAFGEIISKGYVAGNEPLLYGYDQAGRLVSDNQTGATRNYGYNLAGHQVKEWHQAYLSVGVSTTAVTRTLTDRLGRTVQVQLPSNSADAGVVNTLSQRVDRWGNVIEVVDGRGYQTNYQYNDQNKLVRETRPLVKVVKDTVEGTWQRPEQFWYYDALGRLVGNRDANGNLTRYEYDAAGQQTRVVDANGDATTTAYDGLGQAQYTQNPLGYVTFKQYDRLGRVKAHGDYLNAAVGVAREKKTQESYLLNINGDRLQVTDAMGKVTKYDYDSRSLLLRSQSATGVIMEYAYDLGGHKARETYNLAHAALADRDGESVRENEQSWDYDYFGRLIDHNDLSRRDYDYSYDAASGQLITETNSSGLSRVTLYYANGQVREIQQNGSTYRYEYDSSGNRTIEQSITSDSRGEAVNVRTEIVYDSHNRMQRIVQDDTLTTQRVFELTYDYDAAGNRTRVEAKTGYGENTTPIDKIDQAPVVIGLPSDRTVRSGVASQFRVRLSDVFRDPEGKPLTATAVGVTGGVEAALPSWLTYQVDTVTGEMVFTTTAGSSAALGQDFTIRLKAADSSQTAMTSFTLRVRTNTAPVNVVGAPGSYNVKIGTPWTLELAAGTYFTDADVGDSLRIGINGTLPAWLLVDTGNPSTLRLGIVSGQTPTAGDYVLTLVGTDDLGATVSRTITLHVANNAPPTLVGTIANQEATPGRSFSLERNLSSLFVDSNGDAITLQATLSDGSALPSWLSFQYLNDQAVPQLRFSGQVPGNAANGTTLQIRIVATDSDGAPTATTFSLTLLNNRAPTVVTPLPTQSLKLNDNYNFQFPVASLFSDPEFDALTFVLEHTNSAATSWLRLSVDDASGVITLSGKPTSSTQNVGDFTVRIVARDAAGLTTPTTVNFHVTGDNAPVINSAVTIPARTANIGRSFSFTLPAGMFTDPDGDTLSHSLMLGTFHPEVPAQGGELYEPPYWSYSALPAWMTFDPASMTFSGTVPANETERSMTLGVLAYDGKWTSSRNFSFSLATFVNSAPAYTPGSLPARALVHGGSVDFALPAGAFVDADGDAITYTAQVQVGSTWVALSTLGLSINATTGRITGTATNLTQATYNARILASDGSAQGTGTFIFSVNNTPPTVIAIPAQTAYRNVPWSFSLLPFFSDVNQDALTFTATGLPTGLTLSSAGQITGATGLALGGYTVTITANDGRGGTVSQSFTLNLANTGPTAPTIPNQTATAGSSWSYAIPAFTDPNGDALTYTVTGLPSWMTFTAGNLTLSGTPAPVGTWTITVTAKDPSNVSVSKSFTVTTPNVAPVVANVIGAQTVGRNLPWSFQVPANTFSDVNNDTLTYSVGTLPSGISFNPANRTFSGTPTVLGNHSLTVTVSDGNGGTRSTSFTLSVVNNPPQYNGGLVTRTPLEGSAISWTLPGGTFTDANGDGLGYTLMVERPGYYEGYTGPFNEPLERWVEPVWLAASAAGLSINGSNGTISGTATPMSLPNKAVGDPRAFSYRVKIIGSDGSAAVEGIFDVALNRAPAPQAISNSSIRQNVAWSTTLPVFVDSDALTYTVSGLPPGLSFNPGNRVVSGTPSTAGTYTVTYTANDGRGGVGSTSFVVTVYANSAPVAPAVSNLSGTTGTAFSTLLNAFTDANHDTLVYTATGLPPGLSFNASTRVISGTPTTAGTYTVTYTANDSMGGVTATSFQITVTAAPAPNQPPVIQNSIEDEYALADRNWSFIVPADTFLDPNGDTLTYSASNMPSGMTFDPATRRFAMRTPKNTLGATFSNITVTVSDGRGGTVSDSFNLYVDQWDPALEGLSSGDTSQSFIAAEPMGEAGLETQSVTALAAVVSTQSWYAYDKLNRMVVSNGQLSNGQVVLQQGNNSYGISYDGAGNEVAQQRWRYVGGQWQMHVTQQNYSQRGELLLTFNEGQLGLGQGGQVTERRTYDDAGRMTERRSFFPPGHKYDWIDDEGSPVQVRVDGMLASYEAYTYDDDGRVLTQVQRNRSDDTVVRTPYGYPANPQRSLLTWIGALHDWQLLGGAVDLAQDPLALSETTTVSYANGASTGYDAAGRVKGYTYQGLSSGNAPFTHTYTTTYVGWDSYREATITGESTNTDYKTTTSTMSYDVAGRQTEIREHTNYASLDDRLRTFAYDGNGMIVSRRDGTLDGATFEQNATGAALARMNLHNVYANGQQVAGLDEAGKLDVISRLTAFSNSDSGSTQVTVQTGETLRGLAQRIYGNANLWYVIAEANALSDEEATLPAGITLSVPEVKTSANDAQTFKPYNPSEITGPTSPGLPYIEPPDKGCGTLGMVIMVVIAVVIAVYAGPAATAYFQSAFGATAVAVGTTTVMMGSTAAVVGGAIVGGAVTGAAAAAASSAAGSAMGVASFSWRGVAAGAVTGAITAGLSSGYGSVGQAVDATRYGKAAALALGYAGANYAGQKLAGMDVSFNWNSVAASVVGSIVSAKVAPALVDKMNLESSQAYAFASGITGGMVSAAVRSSFGETLHRSDYFSIVIDAFGNALANANARASQGRQASPAAQTDDWGSGGWGGALDLADPNYRPEWLYGDASNRISQSHSELVAVQAQLAEQGILPSTSGSAAGADSGTPTGYYVPTLDEVNFSLNPLTAGSRSNQLLADTLAYHIGMANIGMEIPYAFPGFNASPAELVRHNEDLQSWVYQDRLMMGASTIETYAQAAELWKQDLTDSYNAGRDGSVAGDLLANAGIVFGTGGISVFQGAASLLAIASDKQSRIQAFTGLAHVVANPGETYGRAVASTTDFMEKPLDQQANIIGSGAVAFVATAGTEMVAAKGLGMAGGFASDTASMVRSLGRRDAFDLSFMDDPQGFARVADTISSPRGHDIVANSARAELIAESRAQSALLKEKYGALSPEQRATRIDELSGLNYERRIGEAINNQEYVFRYLSEDGLNTSLRYGSVRGYTTTEFSHSSSAVADGAQILPEWGVPKYGVAIPVNKLNGFSVARPMGNRATVGWEAFTNSYPQAGAGGWSQFLINEVSIDQTYIFRLKP